MRLKTLISLILVGLGTIPLLAIILLSIPQTLGRLELAARQESIVNLEEKNLVLQVRFARLKEQVSAIAKLPGVRELAAGNPPDGVDIETIRQRFSSLMQKWFQARYMVVDLQVINSQGLETMRMIRNADFDFQPLVSTPPPDRSAAYFFIEGMSLTEENVFVGDFMVDHERGTPERPHPATFSVVAPIVGNEGLNVGIVRCTVEVSDILKKYQDDFWFDGNGNPLHYHPARGTHIHHLSEDRKSFAVLRSQIISMNSEVRALDFSHPLIRENERLGRMAWQPIKVNRDEDPILWIGTPVSGGGASEWLEHFIVKVLVFSVLLVGIVYLVSARLAGVVEARKNELLVGLKKLVSGGREVYFDWGPIRESQLLADELNQLGREYSRLSLARQQAEESLRKHLDRLEVEVADRTHELRDANEKLKAEIVVRQNAEKELLHHRDHLDEIVLERTEELVVANAKLAREVDERRRAEQALSASEKQLQAILDQVNTGIFIVDPRSYTIIYANPTAVRLLGKDGEQSLVGRKCFSYFGHGPGHVCPIAARSKKIENAERVIRKKDGSEVTVLKTVVSFSYSPHQPPMLLESMIDITETKRVTAENKELQTKLFQAQKLEAVGLLAAGVAHDFNNLLTVIQGFTGITLKKLAVDDPMRQHLEQIQAGSSRAAGLVRQLLLFSRKKPAKPVPLNVNSVLKGLLVILTRLVSEDIIIETEFAPEPWVVKMDPGSIDQIVMNLAVNARDAMPSGGKLTIITENVKVDAVEATPGSPSAAGLYLRLTIHDTGMGMPPEVLEHIFEPFFTTKESGRGTGLGLAVIYGIVRQHGGWVDVTSEPYTGTSFQVYLPAVAGEAAALRTEALPTMPQGSGQTILLVEDDQTVGEFAEEALRMQGFRPLLARSVAEARSCLEKNKNDIMLLFCDVVLPDGNGVHFADEVLAQIPDLPVIFTSGYSDHRSQWSVIIERGFPFLQKPYDMEMLLQKVARLLLL